MYHLKRRFMKHDRCDMKRSPGGLHVFWPLWAKTGRPCFADPKNSLKLKWLRVNRKWSSLRYLAKISLFSAFLKQRKFFCSRERTFSPKQTKNTSKNSRTSDFFL